MAGHPAQKVRASGPGPPRHVKAVKAAVPQQQHPGCHRTEQAQSSETLAGMTGPEASVHDGVCPAFEEIDALHLGKRTGTAWTGVSAKGGYIGQRVGHV